MLTKKIKLTPELIKFYIRKDDENSRKILQENSLEFSKIFYHQDEKGNTFLHYIAKKNVLHMAKFFIDFEQNIMVHSYRAIRNKTWSRSVVKDENGEIELSRIILIENEDGHLPVHLAAGSFGKHNAETAERSVLKFLIESDIQQKQDSDKVLRSLRKRDDFRANALQHAMLKHIHESKGDDTSTNKAVECIIATIENSIIDETLTEKDGYSALRHIILSKEVNGENSLQGGPR